MLAVAVALALAEPVVPSPPDDDPLRWTAPDDCPSAQHVHERIADYLGGVAPQTDVRVDATVVHEAGEDYRLDVAVVTASGTTRHELASPRCEVLADAVALIAAVALDPIDVAQQIEAARVAEPAPAPTPTPTPEPTPPTVAPAPTEPPTPLPKQRPILRYALRPELAMDFGPLPGFAVGGGFALGIFSRGWRVEVGPVLLAPREAASRSVPGATAEVSLVAARARGCGVFGRSLIELPLCGGVELGVLRGRGTGATIDAQREAPLW